MTTLATTALVDLPSAGPHQRGTTLASPGDGDITLSGASEETWRTALDRADPPPMQWGCRPGRAIVIAPHPDDEILATGGAMLQLVRRGFSVVVLAVTDGEAAQPHASAGSRRSLSAVRACERKAALGALGLADVTVARACIPDGGVVAHERLLTEMLVQLFEPRHRRPSRVPPGPGWCIAPWRQDGHPDHEAAGRAAAAAAAHCGSRLLEYPVWAWQWLRPDDPRFPWPNLRVEHLSRSTRSAKQRAIAAFASQIEPWESAREPILSPAMLQRFSRPFEGFLVQEGAQERLR
jgi:LmbE family N-acetylglucosaminyl deacetylase